MSNDNASRTGRTNGAAPMGSTVAIVVTAFAVILGVPHPAQGERRRLVGSTVDAEAPTPRAPVESTTLDPTATTGVHIGAHHHHARAGHHRHQGAGGQRQHQNGVAGRCPTCSRPRASRWQRPSAPPRSCRISKVLYNADDPAPSTVAELARCRAVRWHRSGAQGLPVPVASGNWAEGSGVVLMLGNDFAGKTLARSPAFPPPAPPPPTTVPPDHHHHLTHGLASGPAPRPLRV
jgi:hypothetical protein